MVELKITKKFLDGYRQHKLDTLEGIAEQDFCYDTLRYLLDNKNTLSNIYDQLGDKEYIKINVISGEVTSRGDTNLTAKSLADLSSLDDLFN